MLWKGLNMSTHAAELRHAHLTRRQMQGVHRSAIRCARVPAPDRVEGWRAARTGDGDAAGDGEARAGTEMLETEEMLLETEKLETEKMLPEPETEKLVPPLSSPTPAGYRRSDRGEAGRPGGGDGRWAVQGS